MSESPGARESYAKMVNRAVTTTSMSGRLLLVDDKQELLTSLDHLVTLYGYEADQALGGQAAMEALASQEYDVVLLDLIMPEISGHDILDFAAREKLASKIIVVSGDSSFSGVKHALHCGAFDFVKKPYEAAELIATIETALRQVQLENRHDEMQSQLKESEELHRFIVNSSPDLVYMLDRNGCFTFVNDRLESMLGFSRDGLVGKHFSELIDADDVEKAQNLFNERRTGDRAVKNEEIRLRSNIQETREGLSRAQSVWTELTAMGVYVNSVERTQENFIGTYGTARDISARKDAEELINFQAYHDLLTHLPNRALLNDRLGLAIAHAQRNKRKLATMFLDLDRFKLVNDTLGHNMGDRLLKAVANRLQSCLRSGDTLSRFGGDEFTLLLPEVRTRSDVVIIAEKILDRLSETFVIDGHELYVGASIGIAMYPEGGDTGDSLVQNADIAMYHVKSRGKNGYQFFSEEMNHQFSTRLSLERELRNGLIQGEFEVFYQPQVSLADGRVTGVEALVRWRHGVKGLVEPAEFLPLAAETGLILQIDEFVQEQAFHDVAAWRRNGFSEIQVSVNLTSAQIEQEGFVERFVAALEVSGLEAEGVILEITESTLMQDIEVIIPKLKQVQSLGARIAIDDFGTGYSSLAYLQQFPINTLKIDRSFVGDLRADASGASIVDAIVAMARGLKLDLVAEGVENRTQLCYLVEQGCEGVQGYVFSPALPATELVSLLRDNRFAELIAASPMVATA
ncbi:MAG: EAL domain-containing protein [Pseudomonadales bacterium]|nr:EAL domain-containing protein [Pseudomonadales bacterium]